MEKIYKISSCKECRHFRQIKEYHDTHDDVYDVCSYSTGRRSRTWQLLDTPYKIPEWCPLEDVVKPCQPDIKAVDPSVSVIPITMSQEDVTAMLMGRRVICPPLNAVGRDTISIGIGVEEKIQRGCGTCKNKDRYCMKLISCTAANNYPRWERYER